jgi:hypothetical protein
MDGTQQRAPEGFAPCGLRRRLPKIRVRQQPRQQRRVDSARIGKRAVAVVGLCAACALLHGEVNQRVGGTRVEGADGVGRAACRQYGQVRHPAEVQRGAGFRVAAQQQPVHERHERRALPPVCHIARAEVGDPQARPPAPR